MITRRSLLLTGAGLLAGGTKLLHSLAGVAYAEPAGSMTMPRSGATAHSTPPPQGQIRATGFKNGFYPVVTPNGTRLPWKLDDGVKVFHLVAEPLRQQFTPGLMVNCWGYNGQTPGPTIEVIEGDRVRIHFTNHLPEQTTVHWHGILLPNSMDGVGGLTQPHVQPGETFTYEFTINQEASTHLYHPHIDEMTQIAMGMHGFFIIHPRDPNVRRVDRDFCIFLNEWRVDPGTYTPVTTEMLDFNYFTMNSHVFPGTEPLVVRLGQRVRVRLANVMMSIHPIHLHGYTFKVTGTDGGPIPESAQWPETTVMVAPGQARDIEFVANAPGDWAFHCHKTHHIMNGMVHNLPNLIGVDPGAAEQKIKKLLPGYMSMGQTGGVMNMEMGRAENTPSMMGTPGPFGDVIDMGGMFTILKVREHLGSYADPGWYRTKPDPLWRRNNKEPARQPEHSGMKM